MLFAACLFLVAKVCAKVVKNSGLWLGLIGSVGLGLGLGYGYGLR